MNPEPLHIAEDDAAAPAVTSASVAAPVPAAAPAAPAPAVAPAAPAPSPAPARSLDARVKVLLLFAYSAALFFVDTAAGMACMAALVAAALAAGRVSARRVLTLGAPAYVLAAFAVLFGSLVYAGGEGVAFDAGGFFRGCMNGARIVLLVFASFAVSLTTASSALADALGSFLRPLRRFRVPVDDAAMVFSVALRFIPVTADELSRVRNAQLARASKLAGGGLIERLRAWSAVFVPVFVGLFRRADALAQAMDARCYGAPVSRTSLRTRRMTPRSAATLVAGCVLLAAIAAAL
ncbi:MAG: energy-coupling factor transporter transmembrane component T [Eggerthellaceae bacterium]|nr:energy-coupling factor transporter transmembrane component T [Eggerthellaceae bacterium]